MKYIYKYTETDSEWGDGDTFIRIDLFDIVPNIKRWLLSKRPRTLIAAENYVKAVDRFVARQNRKARIAAIRANPDSSIEETLSVMLYDAEGDISHSITQQMFGRNAGKGHMVPDASVFEGERWVYTEPPGPAKEMKGIWSLKQHSVPVSIAGLAFDHEERDDDATA